MNQDRKPGPRPDRLRIEEDDGEEAVRKGLRKQRPEGGWPAPSPADDGPESAPKPDGEDAEKG